MAGLQTSTSPFPNRGTSPAPLNADMALDPNTNFITPSNFPTHPSQGTNPSRDNDDRPLLASMHRPSTSITEPIPNPFRDRDSMALYGDDTAPNAGGGAGQGYGYSYGQGRYIERVGAPSSGSAAWGRDRDRGMDREELERQMVLEEPHNTEYWKSMNPRLRMKLILSYGIDWALCILLAGSFEALNFIPGNQREFSLTDTSIQHTFAEHERVPVPLLFAIAFGGPIVFMPIANMLTVKSWWDLHNSYLGLTLGLSLTASLTEIVKVTVGRPRPDLIDRCQPLPGSVDHPIFGLSNVSICTQTDKHILKDGFKSFFSGHSSFSFAGLGFLAFYLAGKLHLFDRRGHSHKAWLAFAPLVGAALIAISRTMDNRHHWHDVTVGSIVGLTLSFFSYRQFYPKLSDRNSHLPHAPRSFDLPRPPIPIPHLPIHSRSGSASMAAGGGAGMGTGIGRYSDLDLEEGRSMEMQRTSPSGGERGNLLHP